jgi:aspartate 1-decarboxylase
MKDLQGEALAVGDVVAVTVKAYCRLKLAQIVGFTAKMVLVKDINNTEEKKHLYQVVKVDPKPFFYQLLTKKAK